MFYQTITDEGNHPNTRVITQKERRQYKRNFNILCIEEEDEQDDLKVS